MFNDCNFLLNTEPARWLYHSFAEDLPIVDYHCHIDPQEIAENGRYGSITELWLGKGGSMRGDHYKWRLMRACGIDEKYITGCEDDELRFYKWAECLEKSVGNPLYHWSHMELRTYFGINETLNRKSAGEIFRKCNERISFGDMTPHSIIRQSKVQIICTTDDPADCLCWHERIQNEALTAMVLPAFRPDRSLDINSEEFLSYLEKLGYSAGTRIQGFADLKEALRLRMEYFAAKGCKLADHGLSKAEFTQFSEEEVSGLFQKRLAGGRLTRHECIRYRTALLSFLAEEYARLEWCMQLHIGVIRNTNSARFLLQGADTGYDSIGAPMDPEDLLFFLNKLASEGKLPKTVIYSIHPGDNAVIDTVTGCFQDESCAGKIQHGSAWWFNDHLDGMTEHLSSLAARGSLGTFIGMLTDSRCLLSFARHDYFRRVLCRLLGKWIDEELYPRDEELFETFVKNICYYNALSYFKFSQVNEQ